MSWIKHLLAVGLIVIAATGATMYAGYLSATSQRDKVAANVARLNEKYGTEGKLTLYSQYVASGRLIGRTQAELRKLLGEPQTGFSGCDFSMTEGWFIGARVGDRTRDPYAADFFVKLLVVEWSDGRQTVGIREDHYPK